MDALFTRWHLHVFRGAYNFSADRTGWSDRAGDVQGSTPDDGRYESGGLLFRKPGRGATAQQRKLKQGDLVRLTRRWDPGPKRKSPKTGIILSVVKAGPIDPREDGDVATVLWEDGTRTQAWDYEVEVVSEQ